MPEQYQLIIQYFLQFSDTEFKYKKLVNLLLTEESHLAFHDTELAQLSIPPV